MQLTATKIEDLMVADSTAIVDHRGAFLRCFCLPALQEALADRQILQINHSRTETAGALRGLHFQRPPFAEMKLVRCIRGRVWDVALDLRRGSATFLHWHAEELSPTNNRMMIIPEGFAHGFQVLEPASELLYLHTAIYHAASEGGVRFDDPRAEIDWPLPVVDLSRRDQNHPFLPANFEGLAA